MNTPYLWPLRKKITKVAKVIFSKVSPLLLAGIYAPHLFAQHAPSPQIYSLSLEELLSIQVKSATLTEKTLQFVPSSVTVFHRDQIRDIGTKYLHELINYVPGFQSFRQGESALEYFHSARGHRSSTKSREVLILVDGLRLNREFDNAMAVPMFALFNVEKIEFIRGPSSAVYGSNAVMGVIDITTIRDRSALNLTAGVNDSQSLSVTASKEIRGWKTNLAVNAFHEAGNTLDSQNYYSLAPEKAKDPRSGEDIQLSMQRGNTQLNTALFDRESKDFYVAERTSSSQNFVRHKHRLLRLKHKKNWNKTLATDVSISHTKSVFLTRSFFGPAGNTTSNVSEYSNNLKLHNQLMHNHHTMIFGIDIRRSNISEFEFNTQNFGALPLYQSSDRNIFGGYIQSTYKFDKATEVTLGGRYDHYNGIGDQFSPRLGIVHSPAKNQTIKLLYGESFRAPTINELYLENTGGNIEGNPDLKPETTRTTEVIWTAHGTNQWITLNGFYNHVDDIISRNDTISLSSFENSDNDQFFHGLEFEYAIEIKENLLFNISGTYLGGLPESDFRQADRLGTLSINYRKNRTNLNINTTYSGERNMAIGDQTTTLDKYWLVNAKWQMLLNKRIGVNLNIRNILDKNYSTPTQRAIHTIPVSNRGREYFLGLNISFD